ncbi:MAG: hypothetical protein ACOY90_16800 [Candidatus Zhuqueibacterota bacterium]
MMLCDYFKRLLRNVQLHGLVAVTQDNLVRTVRKVFEYYHLLQVVTTEEESGNEISPKAELQPDLKNV